ncbi:Hypothetical protein CINCED_3A010997 [Cinara cedri]|uniref:Uncharacterized protein n=1 Tax=Cinara cedri TaxID=506608 RepID=A0A5E4MIP2_9HEMI|nr:Hypothetical protein CINCED_3A010997 [Cinara cedri]
MCKEKNHIVQRNRGGLKISFQNYDDFHININNEEYKEVKKEEQKSEYEEQNKGEKERAIKNENMLQGLVERVNYQRKQNSVGKRPLGRPKLKWEDLVKRDIEVLGGGANWKDLAMNRDAWRIGCKTEWS